MSGVVIFARGRRCDQTGWTLGEVMWVWLAREQARGRSWIGREAADGLPGADPTTA